MVDLQVRFGLRRIALRDGEGRNTSPSASTQHKPVSSDTLNAYLLKNRKVVGWVRILGTRRLENFHHKEILGGDELQLLKKTLIIRDDQRNVPG
jgi:hypothetical protein